MNNYIVKKSQNNAIVANQRKLIHEKKDQNFFDSGRSIKSTQRFMASSSESQFYDPKKNQEMQKLMNDQQEDLGYEVILKIGKENSYDEAYKAKLIKFIETFYGNGHFQLSLYLPHILGNKLKDLLEKEYTELQFQMKAIEFDKSDYLFYQKIYQFKGQDAITPALQMLIFDQSIFQNLSFLAKQSGYNFECNFQKLQCSIPTPNHTFNDVKDQMKFFNDNVQNILDNYGIIAVDTQTKQESNIIYNLVKYYQQQISKQLNSNIIPVIINLNKLKEESSKYLYNDFIQKINNQLKFDKLYLVVEKNFSDLNLIYSEFKKFMNNKNFIYYERFEKSIQFRDCFENEILAQQLQNLQEEFQNVSIIVSQPKLLHKNQFEVQVSCETWQDPRKNTFNFREDWPKIQTLLHQIYVPYVQIIIKEESEILIWQQYLKGKLDKQLEEHIAEEDKRSSRNENQNAFIIKISTKLPTYKEEKDKIKQHFKKLQITTLDIQNDNLQLQKKIPESISQGDFEKMLYNFQQQEQEQIAQIKLLSFSQEKFSFQVIYYNNILINEIQNLIKSKFVEDLEQTCINFPLLQIINHLKIEIPKQVQDKDILLVVPQGNKQKVILIGRRLDVEQFQFTIQQIQKIRQNNRMKIQFEIKQTSLQDEIVKKLKQQNFCETSYDQKKCLTTIEFFKQDFETIYKNLKDLEKSYGIYKIYHFDNLELRNVTIKDIEKKEQVIIDVKNISIINPVLAQGFLLNIENKAQIKFIQGNISQIQCQAIALEFVKNVDFSKEISQNDQMKNIINFIQGENNKENLLNQWKQQSQEKDIEDVIGQELLNHKYLNYLFQIYPKFYRQAANLESNLVHITSLIALVFQKSKNYNITQIAFPLIGYGLFGYSLKSIQQVLIQGIISQLSSQNCKITSVFVVIQNESEYNQVYDYCMSISNQTNINQVDNFGQRMYSQQTSHCQIEIGGDLIDIEDSDANELINNQYQQLNQGEQIDNFPITYPYSKYPFTHSIDLKNNKMIEKKTKIEQTIQFIDLFKQRIYFIENHQVSQSLNQYLIIKDELSKQNEFEIYYTQDEVKIKNNQFYIKTNGFDELKKIIINQTLDKSSQAIRTFSQNLLLSEQQDIEQAKNDPKLQKLQIEILADKELKIKKAFNQLQLNSTRKP